MSLEIERKFLVANEGWKTAVIRSVRIRDGLIANNKGHKARVRIANDVATIALKSRRRGPVRTEFEYAIPYSDAEECCAQCVTVMSLRRFDTSYRMRATIGTSMSTKGFWMAWYRIADEVIERREFISLLGGTAAWLFQRGHENVGDWWSPARAKRKLTYEKPQFHSRER